MIRLTRTRMAVQENAGTEWVKFYEKEVAVLGLALVALTAPAVPAEVTSESKPNSSYEWRKGWNACRAAMLQGAEPVQVNTLRYGWMAAPVEPTECMVIAGFEAELREEFRDPEAWEAFEAMSGCEQAALRAKWCWVAMSKAAPSSNDITQNCLT